MQKISLFLLSIFNTAGLILPTFGMEKAPEQLAAQMAAMHIQTLIDKSTVQAPKKFERPDFFSPRRTQYYYARQEADTNRSKKTTYSPMTDQE